MSTYHNIKNDNILTIPVQNNNIQTGKKAQKKKRSKVGGLFGQAGEGRGRTGAGKAGLPDCDFYFCKNCVFQNLVVRLCWGYVLEYLISKSFSRIFHGKSVYVSFGFNWCIFGVFFSPDLTF